MPSMNELVCTDLWPMIRKLARRAAAKRAAVAYVTSDEYVRFGEGDVLVTDAGNKAIAGGLTSAGVLAEAHERGARLYSLPNLHAKVIVLGGAAVIGSANLSGASAGHLVEAAWVTDSPAAVGMAAALVEQLAGQAERIDEAFLKRIRGIKVKARPHADGKAGKPKKVKIHKPRTWVVGVSELAKDPPEQDAIDAGAGEAAKNLTDTTSGVSWIRWTGNAGFRTHARQWDVVIQIWRPAGAKRPTAVYRHTPILRRQDEANCTVFFVEDFTDCEETSVTWTRFLKLAKQVGLPGKVGPGTARVITDGYAEALTALWGE